MSIHWGATFQPCPRGAQISLAAGVFAVFIGAAIGTLLGLLAGYYEGWWDRLIMRICDVLFVFPVFYWRSLLLRCWEAALLT